jgi:hypothetical protein
MLNLDRNTEDTITLSFENGEVECAIMASFPVNNKDYIALLPLSKIDGLDDDEILLYSYTRQGEEFDLQEITDEDEFDLVADTFDEMLDEAAFNDME